jgi:poly(3-hydroxyoctanoate) depolymerase
VLDYLFMTAIVYLPGASGLRSFWRPVAERLADVGPATLLGWPGFGDEPVDETVRSVADLVHWTENRLPTDPVDVVAQSMGGVVATLLALEHPERVRRLVLCATSGGIDVAALGAADWRPEYCAEFPHVPNWFVVDRTDISARLSAIAAPTLVLYGDQDPLCNQRIASDLAGRIPDAVLTCIPGGEHMMARDLPDQIAVPIRNHLMSLATTVSTLRERAPC